MYEELPALIRHGNRFRPERVRLRDYPEVEWWIEEILSDQQGGGSEDDPIHRLYRFRVTGPIPGRFSERGEWVMVATGYLGRPFWWIRPGG